MLSPLSHPCSVVTCNLEIWRLQSHVKVVLSQSTIHSACSSTFESEDKIERCETNETSSTALFFRLASNAFPDLGSVGRIKTKSTKKNKENVLGSGTPASLLWSLETTSHCKKSIRIHSLNHATKSCYNAHFSDSCQT